MSRGWLVRRLAPLLASRIPDNHVRFLGSSSSALQRAQGHCHNKAPQSSEPDTPAVQKKQIGDNVSRKDKVKFLVTTLLDLKDSKESVYGALDAWVAWEQNFPISSIKRAIALLEKEHQWHKIVQVIKWMLSKGQGTTMNTYGQLVLALDMDHRAKEAHQIWVKKIGLDLHSVPWALCGRMIGIYYRNNMMDNLVKLFKGLEAFDRKPPEKQIVQRVADAYEKLGLLEEKNRVLEKYNYLFTETKGAKFRNSRKNSPKRKKKPDAIGEGEETSTSDGTTSDSTLNAGEQI